MLAIRYIKSVSRYLTVRLLGPYWSGFYTGPYSCIELVDISEPALPGPDWVCIRPRLSGICGSDLATIQARGSPYFSPFVSCPFVLGHEVVGDVTAVGSAVAGIRVGDRVVIEPALSCVVRGVTPSCRQCAQENYGNCENITRGELAPGIQTGYCRDTSGGWSNALVAHAFQIHRVAAVLSDEEAVLMEPFSCSVHAVLKARVEDEEAVLVIGCGTIGLLTIAALRAVGRRCRIVAVAKHPHQQVMAQALGADVVLQPGRDLYPQICATLGAEAFQPELGKPVLVGGADCTFDCVASSTSIDDALRFTRSRGRVVLIGMPAIPRGIDWTALWYKELQMIGSYTGGSEVYQGGRIRTMDLSMRLMAEQGGRLGRLVTGRFPLSAYRQALGQAMHTGSSKAIKTVFEMPS